MGLECTLPEVKPGSGLSVGAEGPGSIPMQRLSAPERTREELRALMNGDLGTAAGRGDLVRLALRLIVEEALEGEVCDVLGRERYERGEDEKAGYRNGYRTGRVKTAEGAVEYSAPQVRQTPEPFVSSVRAAFSGRTRELERLAVDPARQESRSLMARQKA
jgi:putative transposase